MGKIGYVIKRITNMNFKGFFDTIHYIHNRTKKNSVWLFFDIIYCGFRYQAGYSDYKLFEMYNLNRKQRKTIVTRGYNNELIKKYNNKEYTKYFASKSLFNQKFSKFLHRDFLILDETKLEEFKTFCMLHKEIIVKPDDLACGKGIEKIKVNQKNAKEVFDDLIATKRVIVEEVATQCEEISRLHPSSINTLRVITLGGQVVVAFIRIGNHNNVVDNFNHGGIAAPIDVKTGMVNCPAIDKFDHTFTKHPLTNVDIVGLQIPKWDEVKSLVEKACLVIPEVGYVGWDVCVAPDGPMLIEGNDFPGHDIYQLPPHRTNGMGLIPVFEKRIKEMEKEK